MSLVRESLLHVNRFHRVSYQLHREFGVREHLGGRLTSILCVRPLKHPYTQMKTVTLESNQAFFTQCSAVSKMWNLCPSSTSQYLTLPFLDFLNCEVARTVLSWVLTGDGLDHPG